MKWLSNILKLLGLFIFAIVIHKVGLIESLSAIQSLNPIHAISSVLILLLTYLLKGLRWRIIMSAYNIDLSIFKCFKLFCIGLFLGFITPARLGDFGRLYYIKEEMKDWKKGLSGLVMDRIFDMLSLGVLALIAIIYFQVNFDILSKINNYKYGLYPLIGLMAFLLLLIVLRKKINHKARSILNVFYDYQFSISDCIKAFLMTTTAMIITYSIFNYMAWAMSIKIDNLGLFLGCILLGVLSLLPISILGLGIREVSLIIIFQLHGLDASSAVGLSLVIFIIHLGSFIPGIYWFLKEPIKLSQIKEKLKG